MRKITTLIIATIFSVAGFAQANIADARTQGIGANVTVTGIVTNGDELGVNIRYIEDATAGIAAYDLNQNNYFSNVNIGDSITVLGQLADFNGLLEVYLNSAPQIHSSLNTLPNPQLLTPLQIGEITEGELVQMDNVIFNNGGSLFSAQIS